MSGIQGVYVWTGSLWEQAVTAGPMSIVSDSFNRADSAAAWGTSDAAEGGTSQAWTPLSGTWGITGNTAYGVATTGDHLTVLDAGVTNVDIRATVFALPGGAGNVGVVGRVLNSSNYYLVQVNSAGSIGFFKRVAGAYVQLGTTYTGGFSAGDELGLRCVGSTIDALKNGVVIKTATDASLATGTKVGIRADTSGTWRLDRFIASTT